MSSSRVLATSSSTFERTAGCRSLTSTTWMLRMTVLDCGGCASDCEGAPCDCGGAPCACTKAGVPRERAAMMTDVVTTRMLTPFQFDQKNFYPRNLVSV